MPENAAPQPDDAAPRPEPARGRPVGCMTAAVVGVCALLAAWGLWMHWLGRAQARLARRVAALAAEYQAGRPELAEEDNAAPLYGAAFALLVKTESWDEIVDQLDKEDASFRTEEVAGLLAANRRFRQALEGAAAKPRCDFRLDIAEGDPLRLPHIDGFRDAGRFLAAAARHEAQSGRPGEALETIALALRVVRGMGSDDVPFCQLVRQTHRAHLLAVGRRVLNESEPDAAALGRLLVQLAEERERCCSAPAVLRGGRLMTLATARNFLAGSSVFNPDAVLFAFSSQARRADALLWRAGFFIRDLAIVEQRMKAGIALAGEPLPQALDELAAGAGRGGFAGTPRWAVLSSEWAQTCRDALVVDASDLAGIDAARLALGCRLCRLKSGHNPGGLDELPAALPGHFRAPPLDPFSGRPFRYAKTGKGCRVWSVGENRTDEAGELRKDIVFELER